MVTAGRIVDLLVVGGGTAGIVGAKTAAGFGAPSNPSTPPEALEAAGVEVIKGTLTFRSPRGGRG